MRLIDADRLLCVIDDDGGWAYDGLEYQAYMSCLRGVLEDIEEAPTIDPETLRPTAYWRGEYDGYADGNPVDDVWYCSSCEYCIDDGTDDPELLPKYCPNCGAKMGEENV